MTTTGSNNQAVGSSERAPGGLTWRAVRDYVKVADRPPRQGVAYHLRVHLVPVTEAGVELPAFKVCVSGCVGGHGSHSEDGQARRDIFGHVDPFPIGQTPDRASGAGVLHVTASNCTKVGVRPTPA